MEWNKNSMTISKFKNYLHNKIQELIDGCKNIDDHFKAYTCLANYVTGISKNLWLKKLRNRNFSVEVYESYYFENKEEINLAIENERNYWDKLNDYINEISAHCQNLIHDIFMKNKNIDEIQEKYKYSSKHNAQNQKHKCVEQIRKIKKEDNF
jgi:hypothetical protein